MEELDETIAPALEATDVDPRANLRAELEEESEVSFVEIEHGRIIRSVGAREPLPRVRRPPPPPRRRA